MNFRGQKDKQWPHLFAIASDDVSRDGVQKCHISPHGLLEMGTKGGHLLFYWGLNLVDA